MAGDYVFYPYYEVHNWGEIILRVWLILVLALMTSLVASGSEIARPNQAGPGFDEISAKDLMANTNPIIYDQAKIIGDISINQAEYNSIKISNSIIDGNVSFIGSTFNKKVDLKGNSFLKNVTFFGSKFVGEVDFTDSSFHGDANFSQSVFLEGATFDNVIFDKNADFSSSEFYKFGSFYNSTFEEDAAFDFSQFNGVYANLESAKFLKNASFVASTFKTYLSCCDSLFGKKADFHASEFSLGSNLINTTFLGLSRFDRCQFSRDSLFRDICFNDTVDFTSARFEGPLFFSGTMFCEDAVFNSVQFIGPTDFTDAQFYKALSMNSTKISTMVFDNSTFNESSQLFLAKADVNRLMVKWDRIKDILVYDSSAYLSLVKNYRDLGLGEGDDCYYQYRVLSQDSKSWSWSKILDILAGISCGYGVRPSHPVICSFILILLCMTILYLGNGLRHPSDKDKKTSIYDSLYYCLAIFFTIPLPDLKPAGHYRYVPVFLRAISWTLFALLIGTLSKVMIK